MQFDAFFHKAISALPAELAQRDFSAVERFAPEKLERKAQCHKRADYNSLIELAAAADKYRRTGSRALAERLDHQIMHRCVEYGWSNVHIIRASFYALKPTETNRAWNSLTLGNLRHAILGLLDFPQVPLQIIDSLAESLEQVLRAANVNTRDAHLVRYWIACERTDESQAGVWYNTWTATIGAEGGPGLCKQDQDLQILRTEVGRGNHGKAIELGREILQNQQGHMGACRDVREKAAIAMLSASLDSGRNKDAQVAYDYASKHLRTRRVPSEIAQLIRFHLANKRRGRAALLLSNYLSLALRSQSSAERFQFLLASAPVISQLIHNRKGHLRVPTTFYLPPDAPLERKGDDIELKSLQHYSLNELRSIATRFDARNGNAVYSSILKRSSL